MNERMNQWMNEWMNEWNEWMNEWMSEWMNEWWARRLLRHVARGEARRRRQRDNDETTRQHFSAVVHPPQSFAHVQHKPFGYPPHLIRVKQRFTRRPAVQFDTIVANIGEAWRPEVRFDTIVANTDKACIEILTLPCHSIDSSWGDLSHDYFPYTAAVFLGCVAPHRFQ